MKLEDKKRFGVALFWLAQRYPLGRDDEKKPLPRELTVQMVADYFEALQDIHIERFERGVKYHYGHSEFWPSPAALRKSCNEVIMPRDGWLPAPERVQIPEAAESLRPEVAREVAQTLNESFGTSFYVDDTGTLRGTLPSGGGKARGRRRVAAD